MKSIENILKPSERKDEAGGNRRRAGVGARNSNNNDVSDFYAHMLIVVKFFEKNRVRQFGFLTSNRLIFGRTWSESAPP